MVVSLKPIFIHISCKEKIDSVQTNNLTFVRNIIYAKRLTLVGFLSSGTEIKKLKNQNAKSWHTIV